MPAPVAERSKGGGPVGWREEARASKGGGQWKNGAERALLKCLSSPRRATRGLQDRPGCRAPW